MKSYINILFILLVTFISCKGQKNQSTNNNVFIDKDFQSSKGKIISEIDSSIWCVFQDKKHDYWFGTNGQGVFKYNGKTVLQFTTKDGLQSDQIRGIQEDKLGNIFITTIEGVCKFDGQKLIKLEPIESEEWKLNEDDLWFYTLGKKNENGVYRYDGNVLYHLKFPKHYLEDEYNLKFSNTSFSPYEVYTIYKDRKGNMWFGTASFGVCRFDGKALSWLYEDHLTNTPQGGSFGIRSIFEDDENNFWICNTRYRYIISSSFTTKNGTNLIDYTRKNGMGKLTINGKEDYPYFLSMIDDQKGNLWMTTYDQGVLNYDGEKLVQFPLKEGEIVVNLFSILNDDQNQILIGSSNKGVYKFNGQKFEKFKL